MMPSSTPTCGVHPVCVNPVPISCLSFAAAASAAEGLNAGIEQAEHEFVVLVHQDVYLPEGWPARMVAQWRRAERQGAPSASGASSACWIAGSPSMPSAMSCTVTACSRTEACPPMSMASTNCSWCCRDRPLCESTRHWVGTCTGRTSPCRPSSTISVWSSLDAPCHHNSLTGRVPWRYRESERVLARKWEKFLPIHTNLSSIGSWLNDRADAERADTDGADAGVVSVLDEAVVDSSGQPAAIAELIARLRHEQRSLNVELEQARLQVASMQASPFWRAREIYARMRGRVRRRP